MLTIDDRDWHWLQHTGILLIPETLYTIYQIITISFLSTKSTLYHPAVALSFNLILFLLYAMAGWLNPLLAWSSELSFDKRDTWERMCFAETGIIVFIAVFLYIPMIVLSCIAVHKYRKGTVRVPKNQAALGGYKLDELRAESV
jgi:hypothetical protein